MSPDDIKTAGLSEAYFKDGKLNLQDIGAHLTEYGSIKTAEAERAKLIPQDGKYDFSVPKDFKPADGLPADLLKDWNVSEFKIAALAPLAKELNLPQPVVSKFVSAWATADLQERSAEMKAINDHIKTEVGKLGTNGADQLANLKNAIMAEKGVIADIFGPKLGKRVAEALMTDINSADAVREYQQWLSERAKQHPRPPDLPSQPEKKSAAAVLYGNGKAN